MQGYKVKPSNNNDAVQVDVDLLKNHACYDVIVYERQGFLRTVARFDDRLATENQLVNGRYLRKKGSRKHQLEYAERTARKALGQM